MWVKCCAVAARLVSRGRWSHDGKYFAKMAEDAIQVYSTEDFKLLDKKSLKLPGVKEFKWSPAQNIIAAYIPGQDAGQTPARVVLIEVGVSLR